MIINNDIPVSVSFLARTLQNHNPNERKRVTQCKSIARLRSLVVALVCNEEGSWVVNENYENNMLLEYSDEDLVALNFTKYLELLYKTSSLSYEESTVVASSVENIFASYVNNKIASIPLLAAEDIFGANVSTILESSSLSKYQVAAAAGLKPLYNWQRTNKLNLNDTDSTTISIEWLSSLKHKPHTSVNDLLFKDVSWMGSLKLEQLECIGLPFLNKSAVEICHTFISDKWVGNLQSVVNASNELSL